MTGNPEVDTDGCCLHSSSEFRVTFRLFLEEFFDFGYVFGDVHAYRVVVYFGDADFPAIFEPAELLELLDFFEGALGERGVFEKGVALEYV